jgi:hypothetical protein
MSKGKQMLVESFSPKQAAQHDAKVIADVLSRNSAKVSPVQWYLVESMMDRGYHCSQFPRDVYWVSDYVGTTA